MASSTLRWGHARCDCCCSQNLLPAARTMSATSRVGRLIASCVSWSVLLRRAVTLRWLRADWESLAGGDEKDANRRSNVRAWSAREAPGWCADRRLLQAYAWRNCVSAYGEIGTC